MSKRFTFPLQKALDWYRQSLTVEQAALHKIINDIRTLERLKDSLERRQRTEREQLHMGGQILGTDLRGLASYTALIRGDLARLAAERMRQETRLVEQRRKVGLQHRRVKVLEQLEERRKTEWAHGVSVEEDSLASDLYLAAVAREARS
jgi:hypothetical protein